MIHPPRDSVQFEAPGDAYRCGGGRGAVLQGAEHGNGVLVWLRYRDSLQTGDYPVLARSDTATARGAAVSVRFMVGGVAHGVALDSGELAVMAPGGRISARARGSGLDVAGAVRVTLDASFDTVPLGTDTITCRAQL